MKFEHKFSPKRVPEYPSCEFPSRSLGRGPQAYTDLVNLYAGAFDTHFTIEDLIAEQDRVAVRWTVQGRHNIDLTGITIHRIADAQIVESWGNWDALGLMHQLKAARADQAGQEKATSRSE